MSAADFAQCEAHVVNLPTGRCILNAGHDTERQRPATASELVRYGLPLDAMVAEPPTAHVARVEWAGHSQTPPADTPVQRQAQLDSPVKLYPVSA